jgi:putative membrane protein
MTTALLLATHDHDWFPWFPLVPFLFFTIVLTTFVVFGRRRRRHLPRRSGETVLAERYARGEIDEPEYQQRRRVLRGDN